MHWSPSPSRASTLVAGNDREPLCLRQQRPRAFEVRWRLHTALIAAVVFLESSEVHGLSGPGRSIDVPAR
jgi:hypothetical protein